MIGITHMGACTSTRPRRGGIAVKPPREGGGRGRKPSKSNTGGPDELESFWIVRRTPKYPYRTDTRMHTITSTRARRTYM